MPKRLVVDSDELIKAIESGVPSKEIMARFGFKTLAQLKSQYLDALTSQGKVKAIPGRTGRGRPSAKVLEVKVNKRGSLVLPQKMVAELEFEEGDTFRVRKTKSGISLKKIKQD